VAGAYVKQNAVVSTPYNTIDFVRTIEEVLGLPQKLAALGYSPMMNLNDALAHPMADIFNTTPIPWTFTATPSACLYGPDVKLFSTPEPAGLAPCPLTWHAAPYWAQVTKGMDFTDADRVDGAAYNRILWKGIMGDKPYPAAPTGIDLRQNREEPTDPDDGPTDANGTHASYVTHHNGPQYFGYVANNPQIRQDLHGLEDFYTALANRSLPQAGGVFFVKGGYTNIFNLKPVNPDAAVQKNFLGDDDHPSYSDAQICEALVAETINKIAASPYWPQSAIIVTWDDSEGDYDHVPPPIVATGPDQSVVSFGPRVPLLVISPFSKANYISHDQGSHSSVVKFIDTVFGLPLLATLPDELLGRYLGLAQFGESEVGPHDALTPGVSDLLDAFSSLRLMGSAELLPPAYVTVAEPYVMTLPQTTGLGCGDLGIITTDRALGIENNIPADFNPRPQTDPSSSATNTPTPGRTRPIVWHDQ
jgi:hypothetical protein